MSSLIETIITKATIDIVNQHSKQVQSNLDWILTSRSGLDLLSLDIYPNVKEISEASSITRFLHKQYRAWTKYNDVLVVVVGDGATPRLGAMLAFHTNWEIVSIDPLLRDNSKWDIIKRLHRIPLRYEDLGCYSCPLLERPIEEYKVLYVFPHAHVNLDDAIKCLEPKFGEAIGVVAMPCCQPQGIFDDRYPTVVYEDFGCLSPRRTINLWRM